MEEDHNTIYFPVPSLQNSANKKEEMVVKAGGDTVYKALQAGKKKKATIVCVSFRTHKTSNFSHRQEKSLSGRKTEQKVK